MIVKNESRIIARCLRSMIGVVDYICISDTGSTDTTIEEIEAFCRQEVENHRLVDFKVFRQPWKNFGYNRTLSTRSAQKWLLQRMGITSGDDDPSTDENGPEGYTRTTSTDPGLRENLSRLGNIAFLLLDADMRFWLHPDHDETSFHALAPDERVRVHEAVLCDTEKIAKWKEKVIASRMGLVYQHNDTIVYPNIRFLRGDIWIECHCPTHEYYAGYDVETGEDIREKTLFRTCSIEDIGDGGAKNDKFVRDIRLLREALEEEPNHPRYWFYLANSLKNTGNMKEAVAAYRKRIALAGWQEEVFMSYLYMGECYEELKNPAEALFAYMQGYQTVPERAETLYRACVLSRKLGLNHVSKMIAEHGREIPKPNHPVLFLESKVYAYLFDEEASIYSFYVNEHEKGKAACLRIMEDPSIDPVHRKLATSNLRFYTRK